MIKDILDEEEKRNDNDHNDGQPIGGSNDTTDSGDTSRGNESETRNVTGTERNQGTTPSLDGESGVDPKLDVRLVDGTNSGDHEPTTSGGSDRGSDRTSSRGNRGDRGSSRGSGRTDRGNTDRTRTDRTGRTDTSTSEKTPLVVVSESDPIILSVLKPKSQGSPREVKAKPTSQTAKSRSKAKAGDIDDSEMTMFLEGVFALLGSVMGGHWFISSDEAEQISVPLVKMLNKQNKKRKDKVNDMMLPMLLITAIGSIIVPRLIIQTSEWKVKRIERQLAEQKRANTAGGQNLSGIKSRTDSGETSNSSGGVVAEVARSPFNNESTRHDVKESNQYVPSLPPSLIGLSD